MIWSETLKLFAYRSEVGFEILIFMLHGDGKLKNVNLLLIASSELLFSTEFCMGILVQYYEAIFVKE